MQDRKVWEVWDRKVWPPEDYEALLKSAPLPTILHFPPPRPNLKNISKIYFTIKPPYLVSNQTFQTIYWSIIKPMNNPWLLYIYWIYAMLGLSGLLIIWSIYEIFRGD